MSARRSKPPEPPPVVKNVQAIADLERRLLEERTHINRLSEVATRIAGSPTFILLHLAVFAGWVVLNTTHYAFDQSPFNLLNLILALEAIVLTSIVLISQSDLRRLTDLRAHLDLQVNILAEQELTAILGLLNQICKRLDIDVKSTEPTAEALAKETDLETIATVLEQALEDTPTEES
ncbi:MAG TPA: DUF1003 domain-containing protein [Vicinamibacterales bacterium]|nr:DUF1003 domain-containing protein [Vicinamibacterales bacterium]